MKEVLLVNDIFYSIQGESSFAGSRCIFIRLAGCNVKCEWCDTTYAYNEGCELTIGDILIKVGAWDCDLVEVTGGEPLLQEHSIQLMEELVAKGYRVLLETSGTESIMNVPQKVVIIMDIKCPSSGAVDKNKEDNIALLKSNDEIKFVIADRNDYEWAKEKVRSLREGGCTNVILFSPVRDCMNSNELALWILEDNLPVRLQLQLHKLAGMK
ncbi:MAG: hypothetical protein A2Y62_03825 [Candidatus Fischerbacteria bacterium RBG_13_37_8]|uniref:7-carboxy-7-deazaguanine synthase n=1 Tax=Candidatus Fischerbacteria bacterium RBG_13_37_8 TaxID=1817863 RepID=A0A1F5V5U6_9BACT|nr:MAG: hypothetical protein A2Y62_03825 [Candidatus Fischerbacteria bacterium RBG_13_37_8]